MRMAVSGWKNSDQNDSKHIHMSSYVYDCLCMNNFGSLCFVLYLLILSIQSLSLNMFADVACFSTVVNIVGEGHEQLNLAETKTCLVLISQGDSWVQNHFRHFCLLWQDLIGSSAALCENMGHTYSSMGNYDEAPSDSDRHSTTKESVGLDYWTLDYRIACCLGCIALRREIGEKAQASVVQIDTYTNYYKLLQYKHVQTDIQTDWDKGAQKWCIVCVWYCVLVVRVKLCSGSKVLSAGSEMSGSRGWQEDRRSGRTRPRNPVLCTAWWKMLEDGGSMCLFVLLYTNRIKLVTGLPTELESDLDMPLKWKQEISRSRKSLATGTTLVVRSHFYQVTISIISFRKEFCLDSDWLKIAWDTLRRTDHTTCATWATRMCFSLLFIAFHCLDSLDLLRNEHRRGIGRFAAINEKSTITFQLNRLNIWLHDYSFRRA